MQRKIIDIIGETVLYLKDNGAIIVDPMQYDYKISFILKITNTCDGMAHLLEHVLINYIKYGYSLDRSSIFEGKTDYLNIEIIANNISEFENLYYIVFKIIQLFKTIMGNTVNNKSNEEIINYCLNISKKEILKEINLKRNITERQLRINKSIIGNEISELPIGSSWGIESYNFIDLKSFCRRKIKKLCYVSIVKKKSQSIKLQNLLSEFAREEY